MRRYLTPLCSSLRCLTPRRFYTAPPEAIKLYQSNFISGAFPIDCATSEVAEYAQFLYKLNGDQGQYLKDFDAITKLKLPVFWERSDDVTQMADVVKAITPNFLFTLRWIQSDGNLERLRDVLTYYETLVHANKKRLVVNVYLAPKALNDVKVQTAAKTLVAEVLKTNPTVASKASWTTDFKFLADETIREGFYAEFGGITVSTIEQSSGDTAASVDEDIDYTSVKPYKNGIIKTVWEETIESDILRSYFDQLAQLDVEEQTLGV